MRMALIALGAAALFAHPALAQQVERGDRPIFQVATQLKNGEYVWAPELASDGPVLAMTSIAGGLVRARRASSLERGSGAECLSRGWPLR